jgi:hypothetical protein
MHTAAKGQYRTPQTHSITRNQSWAHVWHVLPAIKNGRKYRISMRQRLAKRKEEISVQGVLPGCDKQGTKQIRKAGHSAPAE